MVTKNGYLEEMQVISGKAKGCHLKSPRSIRPTTALVRGAVFSILENLVPQPARVLDLYAGTGALGIEALSRGARWVDFVEQNPRCCAIIKENLKLTGLAAQTKVYCQSVAKALSFLQGHYDVIILDPPYADFYLPSLLYSLVTSSLADRNSVIVVQHSSHLSLAPAYSEFHLVRHRCYGETRLSIYQQEEEVDNSSLSRHF